MNSVRSLFYTNNDKTNQHLLATHQPQKHDDTTQNMTVRTPITHQSTCLPHIDNTVILAQPSTSEHPTVTPLKSNSESDQCKSAPEDVYTNISKQSSISQSSKIKASQKATVETSIRRMNEGIDELEDQTVNIYTEVKKISYCISLMNGRLAEIISRLESIECLMKRNDK